MSVSVQNIYYLLCYAWDRLEARSLVDASAIPGNRIENLLGKVLLDGVAHLIRSGFDRGYVTFEETSRRLRGKVLLTETVGRSLLQQGRVACQMDDLSHDVRSEERRVGKGLEDQWWRDGCEMRSRLRAERS